MCAWLQYFYWEVLDLSRRIVLTGALLIVRDSIVTLRLVVALLASLVWLILGFSTYPFKRPELDAVSLVSAFMLTCIYLGALLVKLSHDLRDNFAVFVGARLTVEDINETVVATLSFRSSDTILAIMTTFAFSVVALVSVFS